MTVANAEPREITMLDLQQVAELFHVSAQTVRRWIAARRIPAPGKVGRRWLWDRRKIEAYLADLADG